MRYLISLFVMLIGVSCTSQPIPTAEQKILAALDTYHTAEREGNLETILDSYSEEFEDAQGTGKAVLAGFFSVLVDQGVLKDHVIDMESMVISVENDYATVGPVSYTSLLGSNTYRYRLQQEEDAIWRFISSEELN